ncbi:MAG: hypothetical protein JO288_05910 [Hyphomicrobiales bacterium]|nr:hypothetical protein [Hyphomicrobiales bacterium]
MSGRDVFINCPFSPDYQVNFRAIVFTVVRSGFTPRCARENDDAGEVRIDKICRIIRDCPYGVHDISKTELDPASGLPRFNMPFELGLFIGARKFGGVTQRTKKTLVFDRDQFRYQKYISDIAGQDIHSHGGDVQQLIRELANWLRDEARDAKVPGGAAISNEFSDFKRDLPLIAAKKRLEPFELTFKDLAEIAAIWVVETGS